MDNNSTAQEIEISADTLDTLTIQCARMFHNLFGANLQRQLQHNLTRVKLPLAAILVTDSEANEHSIHQFSMHQLQSQDHRSLLPKSLRYRAIAGSAICRHIHACDALTLLQESCDGQLSTLTSKMVRLSFDDIDEMQSSSSGSKWFTTGMSSRTVSKSGSSGQSHRMGTLKLLQPRSSDSAVDKVGRVDWVIFLCTKEMAELLEKTDVYGRTKSIISATIL